MSYIQKTVEIVKQELRAVLICDGCKREITQENDWIVPNGWIAFRKSDGDTASDVKTLHACSTECARQVIESLEVATA